MTSSASNTSTTLKTASDVSSVKNTMMDNINNNNTNNTNNTNNLDVSKSDKNDSSRGTPAPDFSSINAQADPTPTPAMDKRLSSTPFWINDPYILLNKDEMTDIWPMPLMSIEQKLNAISRIVILLSILGFLITKNINIVFTGLITLAIFVMIYKLQYQVQNKSDDNDKDNSDQKKKEGFVNSKMYNVLKPQLTTPTINNPMMNVLLPEIAYNPTREQAAPAYNPAVEKEINHSTQAATVIDFEPKTISEAEKLRKKLFADLGDKYEFDDSMRSFYTNPNTTIPNDQAGFAEFCYGGMISCKEGNEFACQRFNPVLGSVLN